MSEIMLFCLCILCFLLLVYLRTIGTKKESGTCILPTYLGPGDTLLGCSRLLTAQRLISIILRDNFRSRDVYLLAGAFKTEVET